MLRDLLRWFYLDLLVEHFWIVYIVACISLWAWLERKEGE